VLFECVTGQPLMPVTKDRVARMMARRYQDVEETLHKTGPALGIPPPLMSLLGRMVAFEPLQRIQTPTQLVEAIQTCRMEVSREPAAHRVAAGPKTLYVVETNEKMKVAFRKLSQKGFRVLRVHHPEQALKQYQQKPYHILIVDAGSVGREAVSVFNRLLKESDLAGLDLTAILLLSEKQSDWASDAIRHGRGAVLFLPLNLKELLKKLRDLEPSENGSQ